METITSTLFPPFASTLFPPLFGVSKINSTKGDRLIINQRRFFTYIDPKFKIFGLDKKSKQAPETEVEIYKLIEDSTFEQFFKKFNAPLEKLFFTQDQIIDFVEENIEYRKTSRIDSLFWKNHFFLTRKHKNIIFTVLIFLNNLFNKKNKKSYYEYFVINVKVNSDDLEARVTHFDSDQVWSGYYLHCVVIPKL